MNGRIVLLSLFSSFLAFALVMAASAQTRTVGVSVGDKFRYTITATFSSDDPNAMAPQYITDWKNTEWMEISITAVLGTNITGQSTRRFYNTTEITADGWVDVDTGSGNLTSFFISANLTAGDMLYNSTFFTNQVINETVPRTYLSEVRDTNEINTTSYAGSNMTMFGDWDKLSGVLVELFIKNTYLQGTYFTSWSTEFQITSSDIWVVPEFSLWIPALLVLIVLVTATIMIFKKGTY